MVQRVLSERYEVRTLLGRGGMAEVWQGFDRRLGRPVAVKILYPALAADPSLPARFDREARTVAALSHPNVVAVHDVGADGDAAYLVMELIEGGSLAGRLAGGPLPVAEAVRVAIGVCAGLEAAAAAGVVHRDVKPANILFTATGQVKVCDFGIARSTASAQAGLTGSAEIVGTSSYMAPEQVNGGVVDARTDVYGLGCVLYAMLTGRAPFTGDSPIRIAWQHVEDTPAPASSLRPDLPAGLDRLLSAMLAKNPADRPAGPGEVRAALEQLDPAPTRLLTAENKAENKTAKKPKPAVLAVVAAVLVAVATSAYLAARPDGDEPSAAPTTSTTTSAPAPTTSTTTSAPAAPTTTAPRGTTEAVGAAIDDQVAAGTLDPDGARDLRQALANVAEEAAEGDPGQVSQEMADLLDEMDDLRRDGQLRDTGYDAIRESLAGLTSTS